MDINKILDFVIQIAMLLFAVSVHESAHGWMAEKFGDPTARMQGRITLNPIAHIDLVGSIIFPIILAIMHAPVFGWAKPVIVNPYNLRNYRRATIFISAAGPGSNIITASVGIGLFLILKRVNIELLMSSGGMQVIGLLLFNLIIINIFLAIFNLIPVPPLDGSGIMEGLLHGEALHNYLKLKPYGFILLLLIIYTGVLDIIARPVLRVVITILQRG
ncbi:MAG TPA: site-2 protease family protein, partial [Candidatus Deferrimicrobium sp.]|nr:site-2 protease family protein [Candidatus Deferrimicrobium sp.]